MPESKRVELMLSVQRALLGAVTDRLFAVTAGWSREDAIVIDAYFIGEPSAEDIEDMGAVSAEVVADFPYVMHIQEHCVDALIDGKAKMLDLWSFRRARTPATDRVRFV
jgi:hypothetical protein